MISLVRNAERLSRLARMQRAGFVATLSVGAILLRVIDPTHFAFGVSCRAITGVPCIFCGMTRALHFLLCGDVARAVYFNWLAIPLLALVVVAAMIAILELLSAQRFVRISPIRVTRRGIALACCSLFALWCLQVWLAIANHKTELLNSRGPLYALLVPR